MDRSGGSRRRAGPQTGPAQGMSVSHIRLIQHSSMAERLPLLRIIHQANTTTNLPEPACDRSISRSISNQAPTAKTPK